jgi:hypothetical protein
LASEVARRRASILALNDACAVESAARSVDREFIVSEDCVSPLANGFFRPIMVACAVIGGLRVILSLGSSSGFVVQCALAPAHGRADLLRLTPTSFFSIILLLGVWQSERK